MADKKRPKKVKSSKVNRYFVLGERAENFTDNFTGIVVVKNHIGVLLKGKPATSDLLERALGSGHIKEITSDDVLKYEKEGYKQYGDHEGGHAENMEMTIKTNDDEKMRKAIESGLKKVADGKEEAEEDENEDEEDEEDEESEDEESEDETGDEDEESEDDEDEIQDTAFEDLKVEQMKDQIKEDTGIPEEKKVGLSKMTKDELIKLNKKYNK